METILWDTLKCYRKSTKKVTITCYSHLSEVTRLALVLQRAGGHGHPYGDGVIPPVGVYPLRSSQSPLTCVEHKDGSWKSRLYSQAFLTSMTSVPVSQWKPLCGH